MIFLFFVLWKEGSKTTFLFVPPELLYFVVSFDCIIIIAIIYLRTSPKQRESFNCTVLYYVVPPSWHAPLLRFHKHSTYIRISETYTEEIDERNGIIGLDDSVFVPCIFSRRGAKKKKRVRERSAIVLLYLIFYWK